MASSAGNFFLHRRPHVDGGDEGLRMMEDWIALETSWRSEAVDVLRTEALARLNSADPRDQRLALQALAFVGEEQDVHTVECASLRDLSLNDDRDRALARLRLELTSLDAVADDVHDGRLFQSFVLEVIRRRRRADRVLENGYPASDLRPRDRWGVNSIALFLDNAMLYDHEVLKKDGPSWQDLARAILRGRDFND